MTRVLSALALLPIVFGTIWFFPPIATLVLAVLALVGAGVEYLGLTRAFGAVVPGPLVVVAVAVAAAAVAYDVTLVGLAATTLVLSIVSLATARRGRELLLDVAASLLPLIYLGVPIGILVQLRITEGSGVVLLLLATIMVSDTAQYYGGRWLGRFQLAPAISPGKTIEGAWFGLAAGALFMGWVGPMVVSGVEPMTSASVGVMLVALGIAGDLFESQLKRGAGLKDASGLIPGHGGVLDRIDSLLFAAPGFYLWLMFA